LTLRQRVDFGGVSAENGTQTAWYGLIEPRWHRGAVAIVTTNPECFHTRATRGHLCWTQFFRRDCTR
jgi:hypothetical protein